MKFEEDDNITASFHISSVDSEYIDKCFLRTDSSPQYDTDFKIKEVSAMLDTRTLADLLEDRCMCSKFAMAAGSTDVHTSNYLFDNYDTPELFDLEAMLDDVTVSAIHTVAPQGINALDLSKVWRIDLETAQRILNVTTQLQHRKDDPSLTRNFKNNNSVIF